MHVGADGSMWIATVDIHGGQHFTVVPYDTIRNFVLDTDREIASRKQTRMFWADGADSPHPPEARSRLDSIEAKLDLLVAELAPRRGA